MGDFWRVAWRGEMVVWRGLRCSVVVCGGLWWLVVVLVATPTDLINGVRIRVGEVGQVP